MTRRPRALMVRLKLSAVTTAAKSHSNVSEQAVGLLLTSILIVQNEVLVSEEMNLVGILFEIQQLSWHKLKMLSNTFLNKWYCTKVLYAKIFGKEIKL